MNRGGEGPADEPESLALSFVLPVVVIAKRTTTISKTAPSSFSSSSLGDGGWIANVAEGLLLHHIEVFTERTDGL